MKVNNSRSRQREKRKRIFMNFYKNNKRFYIPTNKQRMHCKCMLLRTFFFLLSSLSKHPRRIKTKIKLLHKPGTKGYQQLTNNMHVPVLRQILFLFPFLILHILTSKNKTKYFILSSLRLGVCEQPVEQFKKATLILP